MTDQLALPATFSGEWALIYQGTLEALLAEYAKRGPQYQLLAELAAGLYTHTRRLEADINPSPSPEMVRLYLQACEALRKVIDQSQRYTEARRQEVIVAQVNDAVVAVLRLIEPLVDIHTYSRILTAVNDALQARAA